MNDVNDVNDANDVNVVQTVNGELIWETFFSQLLYVTYLFALAGPRVAKHVRETTRATYMYQKTGTGKLKRNGNTYRMVRSVHRPFDYRSIPVRRPVFLKRAPVVRIERGNFF